MNRHTERQIEVKNEKLVANDDGRNEGMTLGRGREREGMSNISSPSYNSYAVCLTVTSAQLQIVSTNQDVFKRSLLNSVTSLVSMSPVRLNNMQVSMANDKTIQVTLQHAGRHD